MKAIVATVLLSFALAGSSQTPVSMTPENIDAAIAHGLGRQDLRPIKIQKRAPLTKLMVAEVGIAFTPYLRVAFAARASRDIYKPFARSEVTAQMTETLVYLYIPPAVATVDAGPELVFVMPKGSKDPSSVIEPLKAEETTIQMQNLLGARWVTNSMTAAFPLSVLDGKHEFVVIYKTKPAQGGGPSGREIRGEVADKNWK